MHVHVLTGTWYVKFVEIVVFFSDLNLKERKWYNTSTTIPHSFSYFVFEATRGGQSMEEDEGDIAIDDVFLYIGQCEGE